MIAVSTPMNCALVLAARRRALDRASGWGVYPTPIGDVLTAANIKVAPVSIFDPRRIMEYLIGKAESTAVAVRSAISKIFGVADTLDNTIHIDHTVRESEAELSEAA